jgi:hypothetical protein
MAMATAMGLPLTPLQAAEDPDAGPTWRLTPYLWAAGFEGSVSAPGGGGGADASARFDDLWDNLELAGAMVAVAWRRGPWLASGDWTWAAVESATPTSLPELYAEAGAEVRGNIVQAFAGRDVLERPGLRLALLAGLRFYDLETTVRLGGGSAPELAASGEDRWLDGVLGARVDANWGDRWEAYLQADAGAGGSSPSWQLAGAVGYRLGWGSVVGGWRHLDADYRSGGYELDASLSGPFVGVAFAWD